MTGKIIFVKQFANLIFDEFNQFAVINQVYLVQEHDNIGNANLMSFVIAAVNVVLPCPL